MKKMMDSTTAIITTTDNRVLSVSYTHLDVYKRQVVGDTRFDRVLDICHQAKQLPLVERFKGGSLTFVAGSSWGPDEDIFIKYFNEHPEMKLVIACRLYTSEL